MSFNKLSSVEKRAYVRNLLLRRDRYIAEVLQGRKPPPNLIVLVGDRPGPGAPKNENYHHTPFYSTKNSSGWLNCLLLTEGIVEDRLLWLNAYDTNGKPTSAKLLAQLGASNIIALGGNAAKWLKGQCGLGEGQFIETYHPQYWKRFRSRERYPLLDILHGLLNT